MAVHWGPTPPLNAPNGTVWIQTPDPAAWRKARRLLRFRWALFAWCVVFAVLDAALAAVTDKSVGMISTHAVFALFQAAVAADTLRRIRNGNRRARENHRSRVTLTGPATFVGAHFPAAVETTGPRLDLPVEKTTERIQAVKLARLVVETNGRLRLYAVWQHAVHPVEGEASCALLPGFPRKAHPTPVPECKCGFHAWKTEAEARAYRKTQCATADDLLIVMHVELFGKVIAHEHGYRAQMQRVLGVEIPSGCGFCSRPADRLATRFEGFAPPVCGVCMLTYRPYFTACLTLGDVASALGCEVTWEKP